MHIYKYPQFWSFRAYFGPKDQISQIPSVRGYLGQKIASYSQNWSRMEISNFWPPKPKDGPPKAPMAKRAFVILAQSILDY